MDYDKITERIIISYDFHSKKEYDEYMDEHPKADKSNHKLLDLKKNTSKNTDKYDKVREKVEESTSKKNSGSLSIKISGSCDIVKDLLSAIGGSKSVKEEENGSCTGSISLSNEKAVKLLSALRGK